MKFSTLPISTACLAALCALFAACESARPPGPDDRGTSAPHQIGLRGERSYFDGKLRVEATIGRGRPMPFKGGENEAGGRPPDGGAGGRRGGQHRGGGGAGGGGEGFGGRGGNSPAAGSEDGSPVLRLHASTLPAVTLRLKFENTSEESLEVQIRDVKSELGDFAARPERLLLAPHQSVEIDPMVSQLGVTSDEFPVTIALRRASKNESHDLILRRVSSAQPPATGPK